MVHSISKRLKIWSGYMCRTTVIFGTLKNGSLQMNSLPSNNCLSYRNVFDNDKRFIKMVEKKRFFFYFFNFFCLVLTIASANIRCLKSFYRLLGKYLYHMLVKF